MIAFIKKIIGFTLLLFSILFLIKSSVPYYWGGEKELVEKFSYYESHDDKINTLFIGSSEIYRHIKPNIFDERMGTGYSSFNLGIQGSYHFETLYLANKVTRKNSLKNLIFLAQVPREITENNLHTIKTKYYLNWDTYIQVMSYYSGNYEQMYNYTLSFIENLLCIGELSEIINFHMTNFQPPEKLINQKGYYSLSDLLQDSNWNNKKLKRRKQQLKRKEEVQELMKEPLQSEAKPEYGTFKQTNSYLESLEKLGSKCTDQNIHLSVLSMPNNPLPKRLNKSLINEIYMGDAVDFPEFYDLKYRFDRGHLNDRGAKLFTKKFANKYKKSLSN